MREATVHGERSAQRGVEPRLASASGALRLRSASRRSAQGERLLLLLVLFLSACNCPGPQPDGGTPDSSIPDSGAPDSGTPDSGEPDSGTPDSGTPDSGIPDAGRPDAGTLPDAGALRCLSVACTGDTTCSLDDGECRCNGTTCSTGQTCECPQGMPGCQPTERVCVSSTRCDAVLCLGGATCDLFDGLCKCGGPGGPVCADTQGCGAARPPQCVGGCALPCDDGQSCDPDDGTCKCGGRGGAPCAQGEVCVSTPTSYACRLACAPLGGQCPTSQVCFIDTRPSLDVAYCAFPSALKFEGEQCTGPTQCFSGHCAGLSSAVPVGTCRAACNPSSPQCGSGRHCEALVDVRDAGFCVP